MSKNKIYSNGLISHQTSFSGVDIADGKYKLKISAKKSISGANGYRVVDLSNDEENEYIFEYKYPIPEPSFISHVPYFDIKYDEENNKYSVNYAIESNYNYEDTLSISGAHLKISDYGISETPTLSGVSFNTGYKFKNQFIPNLIVGNKNKINFDFSAHETKDDFYKRKKNFIYDFLTDDIITEDLFHSFKETIDIQDYLTKEPNDKWEELTENGEVIPNDKLTYFDVKNKTLPVIPKLKRKKMEFDGRNYDFFYSNDNGPFYRARYFRRTIGVTPSVLKRYDSVAVVNDKEDGNELLSLDENLKIDVKKSYDRNSNTMNVELSYSVKDFNGDEMKKEDINYAHLSFYDLSSGEVFEEIDFKNKTKSFLVGVTPSIYRYDVEIYNDWLKSTDNSMSSHDLDIRPEVDETIETTYSAIDSTYTDKKKLTINWKYYLTDVANFKLHLIKIADEEETVQTWDNLTFSNVTIDLLDKDAKYAYYFTFDSDKCIFNVSGRIKYTEINF